MNEPEPVRVTLDGVPETMLWTLNNRASVARKPDGFLRDPLAVQIADAIDYPYVEVFGRPSPSHAYRAVTFDEQVRAYLGEHPGATVVELAAGLETEFSRVDDGSVRWLAVDLPESIEVRERFLPSTDRHRNLAASVLDVAWMDEVDAGRGVFLTAGGLFMYLPEADVRRLVTTCAERFPGGAMVFDTIPRWFSRRTVAGLHKTRHYRLPPMPWGLDVDDQWRLRSWSPRIVSVEDLTPTPRDRYGRVFSRAARLPVLRNLRPAMILLRFAGTQ